MSDSDIADSCLWYCKSTIFQANHNTPRLLRREVYAVCDTAKVRFFKQITTRITLLCKTDWLFVILQKYDFSSKSQPKDKFRQFKLSCLWYCKSTIFQANHNNSVLSVLVVYAVCDTAKVRFFKQITTVICSTITKFLLFVILQKYDFSSKSQRYAVHSQFDCCCLWYCKSTIFQANHNGIQIAAMSSIAVCDTAKVRFFKQITTINSPLFPRGSCLWYCKSTIFQANHNYGYKILWFVSAVCDTAKVRFFKQITTAANAFAQELTLFVILQKYDFSSKSQQILRMAR